MTPRNPAEEDWDALLTSNPKVLWGLVADVVKAVKAGEGERKTGRRPAVSLTSLDELYDVLFPTVYATEPFPQVFNQLLTAGGYAQRTFADTIGFNQATVSRLISGKTLPTVEVMERIAYTLGIRPTYFFEYRAMKLGQVITDVLLGQPELSIKTVRQLATAEATA